MGLKSSQFKKILSLYHRRIPPRRIITPELTRTLSELSRDVTRQLAILVDRGGNVRYVVVGNSFAVWIPDLSAFRLGSGPRLRGLRCVHTHLRGEPLTHDDLTDLAQLRLDLMASIEVLDDGLPGNIYIANLVPFNDQGENWRCWEPLAGGEPGGGLSAIDQGFGG